MWPRRKRTFIKVWLKKRKSQYPALNGINRVVDGMTYAVVNFFQLVLGVEAIQVLT